MTSTGGIKLNMTANFRINILCHECECVTIDRLHEFQNAAVIVLVLGHSSSRKMHFKWFHHIEVCLWRRMADMTRNQYFAYR